MPSEPHRVTYGAGAQWVGNWHDDSVSRIDPATNQVVPTSRSASQPPGHERPRPPHARPCRPAGRPQPWLARSTPPAGGSPASARSRSIRCKPAHDSATGACAIRAPPGGHRSAGRAPALRGGRGGWPAHRSPHSRSPWPWSGRPAATRHPPAQPRRPPSRPGPAASTQTHYCGDPPEASSCWTSDIRKICEAPGAVWSPTAPSAAPHHASWAKSLITQPPGAALLDR